MPYRYYVFFCEPKCTVCSRLNRAELPLRKIGQLNVSENYTVYIGQTLSFYTYILYIEICFFTCCKTNKAISFCEKLFICLQQLNNTSCVIPQVKSMEGRVYRTQINGEVISERRSQLRYNKSK